MTTGSRLLRADSAERRQLTVMFCDLVGSTPFLRGSILRICGIIGAYHRCVTEIVEGFGGFVARFMGDGALAYFGYPQAHEDDAERATRCGLALVDRVPQLSQAEELHARVGIATGLVVVGGEVVEHDVAGDTPNLAARLQALAEPDTVVSAAGTRRLTGELFEYRDLGEISCEILDLTVDRVRSLPVLPIVTFRPEFQPPCTGQPQATMLALNRLDRRDLLPLPAAPRSRGEGGVRAWFPVRAEQAGGTGVCPSPGIRAQTRGFRPLPASGAR